MAAGQSCALLQHTAQDAENESSDPLGVREQRSMKRFKLLAVVLVLVATAISKSYGQASAGVAAKGPPGSRGVTAPATSVSQAGDVIAASGMAGLRLGMTLDDVRRALPAAAVARTSDGDGAALVEVTRAPNESVILWAGEENPDAPIDWSKKIETIETFSAAFHTAEGVRVGALVTDVERVLGQIKEIIKSEIESREYVEFERQPAYLTFRLDYTGIFPAGQRTTTQVAPGSTILSIAVSARSRR